MIYTTPLIAFITHSGHDTSLITNQKPTVNKAFQAYILRNTSIVLTHTSREPLLTLEFNFLDFKQMIKSLGQNTVLPTTSVNHQLFIFHEGTFEFVRIDAHNLVQVINNTDVFTLFQAFNKVYLKENKIFEEVQHFSQQLFQQKLTEFPEKENIPERLTHKPPITNSDKGELHTHKSKRSFFDIFSPFSLSDTVHTSNKNWEITNQNFRKSFTQEKNLAHRQTEIVKNQNKGSKTNIKQQRQLLYLDVKAYTTNMFNEVLRALKVIFDQIQLDYSLQVTFDVINKNIFCKNQLCYSKPSFSVQDPFVIIHLLQFTKTLYKSHLVTCNILEKNYTSRFHGQIGVLKDGIYHFKNDLPSLTHQQLISPQNTDQNIRPIRLTDLIYNNVFLIYSGNLISVNCLKPDYVTIDNEKHRCSNQYLKFLPLPNQILYHEQHIFSRHTHHLYNENFMDRKFGTDNLIADISDFDHSNTTIGDIQLLWNRVLQMGPVHYALFGTGFVAFSLCTLICCACCIFYCPTQLAKICCSTCCRTRLTQRGMQNDRARKTKDDNQKQCNLQLLTRDGKAAQTGDPQT